MADFIVLNKSEGIDLQPIEACLKEFNIHAELLKTNYCELGNIVYSFLD